MNPEPDPATAREEAALDTLITSFFALSEDQDAVIPLDDPAILSVEDRKALDAIVLPWDRSKPQPNPEG